MAQASHSSTSALTVQQAAGAIVALINERPISPRQDEVEAIIARAVGGVVSTPITELESRLLGAVDECLAAEKVIHEGTYSNMDDANARFWAALEHVDELAAQLPTAPPSPNEIVLRAKVAFCHADKD